MDSVVKRKNIRLKNYDYSSNGYYFVTICTKDMRQILWKTVGAAIGSQCLSHIGNVVEAAILNIPQKYDSVSLDKYVIMPNHVHMIIILHSSSGGLPMAAPTIGGLINKFKGYVSKQLGFSMWQKLFYDHIIRDEQEYIKICRYIDYNPIKWHEDKYFRQ